ncbi:Subtilisin-like protease SBT4.4 [Sesamum angolense]|uniref:Subtilisin-like protease SBT4.4 n=1 Tax=Sesamum angolense TaxID=2727404 RepID=A0AAE1WV93_9LAMI|nr:Subtilisin-like protease SBT4.4 [Sesamum angolense]
MAVLWLLLIFLDMNCVYIVYLGALPQGDYSPVSHHAKILQEVVSDRSYTRSFNAFAANLTDREQKKLASHDDVVSVFPSTTFQRQTTRSWDFMGLHQNVRRNPAVESNIIVGVIDDGIWPESESFSDRGIGPVPKKWKGACNGGKTSPATSKLLHIGYMFTGTISRLCLEIRRPPKPFKICLMYTDLNAYFQQDNGARWYTPLDASVKDGSGHGTICASIAAGNYVENASFYGIAQGTARGGVPAARIAAYKACGAFGCESVNLLSAFNDAIADGVDIISLSLGGGILDIKDDVVAIGALHATQKGILTVNAGGNSGHGSGRKSRTASVAPWLFSVAASTTDRRIVTKVALGNGATIIGKGVNSFKPDSKKFTLIHGENATSSTCTEKEAKSCEDGCLNSRLVKGKILICEDAHRQREAMDAGAYGVIEMADDEFSSVTAFPASDLSPENIRQIQDYAKNTKMAMANILTSESTKQSDAPIVARFSSRGPNLLIPEIMKPDVTAPGVEILAAYSPKESPSNYHFDHRSVKYTIVSGTSMSCPHVAGAAAYVKSMHPNWSPSAIKSALMTTAKGKHTEFSYGAGHINPVKAANPGLVYEMIEEEYVKLLCYKGYSTPTIRKLFGNKRSNCSRLKHRKWTPKDLNYPAMASLVCRNESFTVIFSRTVTNVGGAISTYRANISAPSGLKVIVQPQELSLKKWNEKKSFIVKVGGKVAVRVLSASLEWNDGKHNVRSPIVIYTKSTKKKLEHLCTWFLVLYMWFSKF